eukprot:UN26322
MYNYAYRKPMHKNDEGCFSYALFNDPEININLYPYQIHDHHIRAVIYTQGRVFACNGNLADCKGEIMSMIGEKNCGPKYIPEDEIFFTGKLVNQTDGGNQCMRWVPKQFRSCF